MFLKNTSKKDIKLRSFEGYRFSVPTGVSAIWTPAGEALLAVYKVESKGGQDKFANDNGHGLPALTETTEAEWAKAGKKLAEVKRFKINVKLIPRASLIKVALQRGIPQNRCMEYQLDSSLDTEVIGNEINALPVPDEIKYPVSIEDKIINE